MFDGRGGLRLAMEAGLCLLAAEKGGGEHLDRDRAPQEPTRWGSAEDVAQAVMYLLQADFVTGEVIVVDGGERFGHRKPKKTG